MAARISSQRVSGSGAWAAITCLARRLLACCGRIRKSTTWPALTPALSLAGAYTFTDGAYSTGGTSSSPRWHEVTLQTDYSLSKRTDLYAEGVYQHVSGCTNGSALNNATINTLSPSSTNSQVAITVGVKHAF